MGRAEASAPGAAPRLVLGTAGHIDHGKTALVAALTGVDTDRLPEEKARGISIELGFAPLDLEGGLRLGVVDVPGHEALVRTMVAGATGIDLVLLVVAADAGVMPQTREHLAICELLGVTRGAVALSRIDLVSRELAELAAAEVTGELAKTGLAALPVVRVSARTGEGIAELRAALAREALAAPPRTPRRGPPRLAIDRAFAARGFGAVVTGTLVGGELAVGDAVEILPSGARARVRGLQSHGEVALRVAAGARCAANLQGVELADLARGQVVTRAAALEPATVLDVQLGWLGTSPPGEPPVSVLLLAGTAERPARVAPIGAERIEPGGTGFARIHVDGEPLPVLPGDRFIVRGFARSPAAGATLGGGTILDVAPPRRRRSDPVLVAELEELARREPERDLAVRIRRAGLAGAPRAELARRTGLDDADLSAALAALAARSDARETAAGRWLAAEALARLEASVEAALDAFHAAHPLEPSMPGARLRGSLPENVARDVADLALETLRVRGALIVEGERVRRPGHGPCLSPEQQALADVVLEQARAAGLEPPGLREWAKRLDVEPDRLRELFAHLERQGQLVRVRGDLWFERAAVDRLRKRVLAHFREHDTLDTAAYKALIGTSRRTAVPLMEHFDAERLTARHGDVRVLRSAG